MRATNRNLFAALTLAATMTLGACNSTGGSQNVYTYEAARGELTEILGSKNLTRSLEILNYRSRKVGDLLQVQFDLRNKKTSNLRFDWAVDWFDAQGFRIDDTTRHWKREALGPGGMISIQVIAPRPEAQELRLQFATPSSVR